MSLFTLSPRRIDSLPFRLLFVALVIFAGATLAFPQATISTGSIQGAVLDPSGAVIAGAKVTLTNKATGETRSLTTSSSGSFSFGVLIPSDYTLRIEAKSFKTTEAPVKVAVGVVTTVSVRLQVGAESQVVTVEAQAVAVNTEQATVQGVITMQQIENLPINGRNFLELAQLEPGVQIQDGGNFDPTKNGFSSISFGGRFGRTARISVDGIDISDETVGTTTQNIPQVAIQEFQISQSSLDLSTELTSSGAVNVITRSGGNKFHGEAFYLFRDDGIAAALPGGGSPFQRHQFGGRFGGAIVRDKLFFFISGERTKQDLLAPVVLPDPFSALSGNFNSPFRDSQVLDRLDWKIKPGWTLFYRFSYEQNSSVSGFIPNTFEPFANRNNTPVHALGFDFSTGSFSHSIRFGYTKFRNGIADAVTGSSIFNPAPEIELEIGPPFGFCTIPGYAFCSGPNILAPQKTFQSNKQIRYDGSKVYRSHTFRYGISFNRILGGGFAKFFGIAPSVNANNDITSVTFADNSCGPGTPCFPDGSANPLNYPADTIILGNGQGFFTERPGFGFPAGGQFDDRLAWYIGDVWKLRPNFTLSIGLRYVRDTGRTDSDIAPIPALDLFGAGLGNRVRQPNHNFAPQLGIAWDPWKNGKTVFRGGAGIFYENVIFNNVLFDRPGRLQQGLFFGNVAPCIFGTPSPVVMPDGSGTVNPTFCGQAIGSVASQIAALQTQYQAATVIAGVTANPSFIGSTLTAAANSTGTNLFAPNYRTPRSFQMNVGVQRELWRSTVLSADYVRNVQTHSLLAVDVNHVGDAGFLDVAAAQAAVATTLTNCGVATINQSIILCPLDPANGTNDLGTWVPRAATIADYALNGLDSGIQAAGGFPAPGFMAFPGVDPTLGTNQMLFSIGRAVYNAFLVSLRQDVSNPFRGVKHLNLQVSYAFSRSTSPARDTDFVNAATDFRNPTHFIGPNSLDRKHQLSFGAVADLPHGFRASLISHFYSGLPLTLTLPQTGPGEIFRTDVTGDGTTGDPLPGTNIGSFGRGVSLGGLNNAITNYNSTQGGTPTPAGQALVSAGLFTSAQLVALGGVQQPLALAPTGHVGVDALRAFDLRFSWVHKFKEGVEIEPSMGVYNLFNFANFDSPAGLMTGELNGQPGSVNGTTRANRANRIGVGTGVFSLGAPRVFEFGLKLSF